MQKIVFFWRGVGPGLLVQGPSLLRLTDRRCSAPNTSSTRCKEAPKTPNLPTRAVAKRQRQSDRDLDSAPGQPRRSSNQKKGLRFGSKRPVDAHFRFGLKTAPTPNEAEPRLHFNTEAAPTREEEPLKISTRLAQRSGSYGPPNIASKSLLLQSAIDRRQRPRGSRKFLWSISTNSSNQQKRRRRITTSWTPRAASRSTATLHWRTQRPRPAWGELTH